MSSTLQERCFGEEGGEAKQQRTETQSPHPHTSACRNEGRETLQINSEANKATRGHQDKHQKAILRFRLN